MKLAVTLPSINSIDKLSKLGADIFIIGNDEFANRLHSSVELDEMDTIIKKIHTYQKEVYLNMNLIMHESDIEGVDTLLDLASNSKINGIIFGDLGVYMMAKRKGLESKLIYHPETLNTNYYDSTFWNKKGIKGITISKEITLEDSRLIGKNKDLEVSFIGHGYLNMFHSRRPLIKNFFDYTNKESDDYIDNRNLHLVEEIRNENYPIFQDKKGTHIFREKAIESFKEVLSFKEFIDVFIIDGILQDEEYIINTLKHYKHILTSNDLVYAEAVSKEYSNTHDSGFLFKKTKYDKM